LSRGSLLPLLLAVLLGSLLGCGRDVAQTAERLPPDGSFDCASPAADVALPSGAPFGDGKEPASALVGIGYGPGAGPGLFVVARDRFRVYLNGELVRESTASRVPDFVPLTVLPGDNVLAVVVAASAGMPAALVQLDELERSYPSDSSWRVSTSPIGNFHDSAYDDSGWLDAQDAGAIGTRPGCDPSDVFPVPSDARWIAPAAGSGTLAVFRKLVRVAALGYGAAATGGLGAKPALVTTFDELADALGSIDAPAVVLLPEGVHDFRLTGADVREQMACPIPCDNDMTKIAYTLLTGGDTCPEALVPRTRNERRLDLGSNKTLVGLGRGAAVRGVSLNLAASRNVIVRNLALYDVNPALIEAGDAFSLDGASQVWLDHCTTKWISDGFTDVGPGSTGITISWLHYDGANTDACTGKHPRTSQITDSSVTFHHSYFDHVESHSPLVDQPNARVHVLNSFMSDNPDYAIGAACRAQVLMEGNVFEAVEAPTLRTSCPDDSSLGLIRAPAGSNLYRDDVGAHRGGDGLEPSDAVLVPPYAYTVEAAQEAWLSVLSRAGAGGPWALPLVRN
jgi:pectate lyase